MLFSGRFRKRVFPGFAIDFFDKRKRVKTRFFVWRNWIDLTQLGVIYGII